jgi:hypothetical protein
MRYLFAFLMLVPTIAFAQTPAPPPRTYTLTMTADEVNTVLNKIGEMPWKDINPVLQKLIGQINAQNGPSTSPTPPPTAPKE